MTIGAARLTRKQVILVKLESSYSVDPSPSASVDAILVSDPKIKENVAEEPRSHMMGKMGALPSVAGMKYAELTFQLEVKGSGSAGTPPRQGRLLRMCGFSETISAGSYVDYDPADSSHDSGTIYFYKDGVLHKLLGARGNIKITAQSGKIALYDFSFQGLWVVPTDVAVPSPTFETTVPPIVKLANFTLNGVTDLVIQQLDADMQNKLSLGEDMNVSNNLRDILIVDRDPVCNINPQAELVATYDFRTDWLTNPRALSMVIGSAAGNKCTISAPKFNVKDITPAERNDRLVDEITGQLAINSGEDEIKIKYE